MSQSWPRSGNSVLASYDYMEKKHGLKTAGTTIKDGLSSTGERQTSNAAYGGYPGIWTFRHNADSFSSASSSSRPMLLSSELPTHAESKADADAPITQYSALDSDGAAAPAGREAGASWFHASAIVVGEIMGSGILNLPASMAKLGWVLGCIFCVIFAFTAMYAGSLLSRTRKLYPKAQSFG